MKKLIVVLLALGTISVFASELRCGSVGSVGINSVKGPYLTIEVPSSSGYSVQDAGFITQSEFNFVLFAKQNKLQICVMEREDGTRSISVP